MCLLRVRLLVTNDVAVVVVGIAWPMLLPISCYRTHTHTLTSNVECRMLNADAIVYGVGQNG